MKILKIITAARDFNLNKLKKNYFEPEKRLFIS